MYFPWTGFLEEIHACNIFVHYVDIASSRGFGNRVEIKTSRGSQWLTVPLHNWHQGQRIDEVRIDSSRDWRRSQRDLLAQAYAGTPYRNEMLNLVDSVFAQAGDSMAELAIASTMAEVAYFGLDRDRTFLYSSTLDVPGNSTARLLNTCKHLGATTYITGHGARNYLDHDLFEDNEIDVRYMNYMKLKYPQQHGNFTPFVSALDLIANCGKDGAKYLRSETRDWKDFVNESL